MHDLCFRRAYPVRRARLPAAARSPGKIELCRLLVPGGINKK